MTSHELREWLPTFEKMGYMESSRFCVTQEKGGILGQICMMSFMLQYHDL